MNITFILQLIAELNIMDISGIKPNYAALARKYDMDYRTVKKYHEGYQGKPKNRNKPSKLDEYEEVIIEKFSIPRTTMKGVHEFLVDQYGMDKIGSYSNFKIFCKKNKIKPKKLNQSGGTTRYETNPGDMAQCNWKENIRLTSKNGEVFVINIFHLVMKFSRYSYIELTLSKEQQIVFRCLINAFKFYGGIPKRILFDNMSTVVDTNVKPKRINHKMMQFSKDMNFKIETLEDLQKLVGKLNVKMNINICAGTDIAPCLLFLKEKEYLTPFPNNTIIESYLSPHKVQVSSQQLVYYQGIQYSVDQKYINEYVSLEQFEDKLQIYYKGKLIQVHSLSRNPINYAREHYEQSIHKQLDKNDHYNEVILNNLAIMDNLLENRNVSVTKDDATKSYEHMIAYLVSQGSLSNWIKRFVQTLDKKERNILYE